MKFLCANRIAPDGTPRSAASHLGLCCLPISHKKDARLKCVKVTAGHDGMCPVRYICHGLYKLCLELTQNWKQY